MIPQEVKESLGDFIKENWRGTLVVILAIVFGLLSLIIFSPSKVQEAANLEIQQSIFFDVCSVEMFHLSEEHRNKIHSFPNYILPNSITC